MEKEVLKTIIKYPGSKWRLADWIISHMPEHRSYLEPFFGSGAVFFRKSISQIETINDIDDNIVNVFSCVRNDIERLCYIVANTPFARKEYYNSIKSKDTELFEKARLFLVRSWQGHGSDFRYNSGWKNDIAGRDKAYSVKAWNDLPEKMRSIVSRLKQAQIECVPAIDVIKRFNYKNVLIYADPPYLLRTRKNKKRYKHEMTDDEHIELLEVLHQHKGSVLLSGYDNDIYREFFKNKNWVIAQKMATTEKGKSRMETLWIKA